MTVQVKLIWSLVTVRPVGSKHGVLYYDEVRKAEGMTVKRQINFSQHALLKFEVLAAHGLILDEELVRNTVLKPVTVLDGYRGRRIAQGPLMIVAWSV